MTLQRSQIGTRKEGAADAAGGRRAQLLQGLVYRRGEGFGLYNKGGRKAWEGLKNSNDTIDAFIFVCFQGEINRFMLVHLSLRRNKLIIWHMVPYVGAQCDFFFFLPVLLRYN